MTGDNGTLAVHGSTTASEVQKETSFCLQRQNRLGNVPDVAGED
jgi:hypothetical protein